MHSGLFRPREVRAPGMTVRRGRKRVLVVGTRSAVFAPAVDHGPDHRRRGAGLAPTSRAGVAALQRARPRGGARPGSRRPWCSSARPRRRWNRSNTPGRVRYGVVAPRRRIDSQTDARGPHLVDMREEFGRAEDQARLVASSAEAAARLLSSSRRAGAGDPAQPTWVGRRGAVSPCAAAGWPAVQLQRVADLASAARRLRCHYCGFQQTAGPQACPTCGDPRSARPSSARAPRRSSRRSAARCPRQRIVERDGPRHDPARGAHEKLLRRFRERARDRRC